MPKGMPDNLIRRQISNASLPFPEAVELGRAAIHPAPFDSLFEQVFVINPRLSKTARAGRLAASAIPLLDIHEQERSQ